MLERCITSGNYSSDITPVVVRAKLSVNWWKSHNGVEIAISLGVGGSGALSFGGC